MKTSRSPRFRRFAVFEAMLPGTMETGRELGAFNVDSGRLAKLSRKNAYFSLAACSLLLLVDGPLSPLLKLLAVLGLSATLYSLALFGMKLEVRGFTLRVFENGIQAKDIWGDDYFATWDAMTEVKVAPGRQVKSWQIVCSYPTDSIVIPRILQEPVKIQSLIAERAGTSHPAAQVTY